MDSYHPLQAPDGQAWLALDEAERFDLIVDYHEKSDKDQIEEPNDLAGEGEKGKRVRVHAAFHVIVETQLAMQVAPVYDALQRVMKEGLDRHEAIHAIASVLAEDVFHILSSDAPGRSTDLTSPYYERLSKLTATSWREGEV